MQATYPDRLNPTHWDPVHLRYPVQNDPETCKSSEHIAREPRIVPEILKPFKATPYEIKNYQTNHNIRRDLIRSQTAKDYSYKISENNVLNKHTSCDSNEYVYPSSRNLCDGVPPISAHGVTEARSAYKEPILYSRLITEKDQFKIHNSSPSDEPIFAKEIEPLHTTNDGFEKYLDPYLTTSRLHHRPFTAAQRNKHSNRRDVITYYTYSETPWVRSRKPCIDECKLPLSLSKSIYDREEFKQGFREVKTHNKLIWVPGKYSHRMISIERLMVKDPWCVSCRSVYQLPGRSNRIVRLSKTIRTFRTEVSDNYAPKPCQLESKIYSNEDKIKMVRSKTLAALKTNILEDDYCVKLNYGTENSRIGSGKPLCQDYDPYIEKSKRLDTAHRQKQK